MTKKTSETISSLSFTEFNNFFKELCPFLNQLSYNCAAGISISVLQTHLVIVLAKQYQIPYKYSLYVYWIIYLH